MPTPPGALSPPLLIALAVAGVAVLVVLVSVVRLHAFVALTTVALAVGLAAGLAPGDVVRSFQDGVGATLGAVALVIALGALLGTLLAESGGAEVVANAIVGRVSVRQLPWAVGGIGFVLGTPVFFPVGLVLLVPVVRAIAAAARVPFLLLAVPLIAGLSASHGLVPPHPGPIVAVGTLKADPGLSLVYSLLTAAFATIVAGPLFAMVIVPRLRRPEESTDAPPDPVRPADTVRTPPALLPTLITVLLPVILMLGGAVASLWLPLGPARTTAAFLGNPLVAMAAAVFAALAVFGWRRGVSTRELLQSAERSLWPVAGIVLVVGAGGGFGRVLDQAGVGRAIADAAAAQHLSPLVLGWVLAALLRLSVGSATVAISTGAGLMLPLLETMPGINRELLVVSLGAGSIIASHVNDGGFWLVKEYLNLTVFETFAMWTVLETLIALAGLAAVLFLSLVVA